MREENYIFSLMRLFFWGFAISLAWGIAIAGIMYALAGEASAVALLNAYVSDFNLLLTGGLTFGTALFVYANQSTLLHTIDRAFVEETIDEDFSTEKRRYLSITRSVSFSAIFFIIGFFLFAACSFPVNGEATIFMILPSCAQYGAGVYVGRKLFYAARIIACLESARLKEDVLNDETLNKTMNFVNITSTSTLIFTYFHVTSFYNAPFQYDTMMGLAPKIFLLLPAVIAAPVLVIFNFFPRTILRTVYQRAIQQRVAELRAELKRGDVSTFERLTHIVDFQRLSNEELRHRLKVSLADLPIFGTIILMVFGILFS